MKRFLYVDIGNSSVSIKGLLTHKEAQTTIPTDSFYIWIKNQDLSIYDKVYVSSVVPSINIYLKQFSNVYFFGVNDFNMMQINITEKNQVGIDRLLTALGAYKTYESDCLVIDSGTAVTFCLVKKTGVYEGGMIFPGTEISSKALNMFAEQLPLTRVERSSDIYGKNTFDAIKSGLYWGYLHMFNGIIDMYKLRYSSLKIIGTGGGLDLYSDHIKIDVVDNLLIFKGMEIISKS